MKYREFGRLGLRVSQIGYGAWGIGGKHWLGGQDDESMTALRGALKLGLNFIDTALAYGDGHSEQLVGRVLRETQAPVFVATKVPPKNRLWPARQGIGIKDVFPNDHILNCTKVSLRNLGVETIGLQQLHVWNPEWLLQDEWQLAFEHLKRSGMVRAVGISVNDHDPDSVLDVLRTGLVDAVQVIYNVFDQSPERYLLPLCREYGIAVIARVPLDEGALTGEIDENSEFLPGDFRTYYFRGDHKRQVADRIAAIRHDLGDVDLAATSLRFCLSHSDISTVIPGMRRLRHVEANIRASDEGPLPAATVALLRRHAWNKNFARNDSG